MIAVMLLFSFLRPRNNIVYAPKLKYADAKHVPPEIGNGLFAWVGPVSRAKEAQLVDKLGMDGAVFLRFTRMCRNIFLFLSLVSLVVLIPANAGGKISVASTLNTDLFLVAMSPQFIKQDALWAHVFGAYLINAIMTFFLWRNYIDVTRLRKQYFISTEYLMSLHARTLLVTDLPKPMRSDEGIQRLIDDFSKCASIPQAFIGRNVGELPELIEEHAKAVQKLESVLSKYLKNPASLPSTRPTIKPSTKYRRHQAVNKVDAIDYFTDRIRELEGEINHIRDSVDKRNAMPYGFATYEKIEDAHTIALETKKKHPKGATIRVAPRPNDLIWQNLSLSKKGRRWKHFMVNMWISVLTVFWIVPNAMIAIFLSNFHNIALVWPAFKKSLDQNRATWSVAQGIASPAVMSGVYLVLPIIFRRLYMRAGDTTKSTRERHVATKLYAFFVFNNLIIFSIFAVVWAFVAAVFSPTNKQSVWDAIRTGNYAEKQMYGLASIAPFWITWLLQRNMGAAADLSQGLSLIWGWIRRTYFSPTPRQRIEWTAPPAFDYAVYINFFLFYSTVALSFVTLQPIVLPITAFYFAVDYFLKKYLLLYIFVTKNESGGTFWRAVYNRLIFAMLLSDGVIAVVIKGSGGTWNQVYAMAPLPFLLGIFKWYCARKYDDPSHYFIRAALPDPEPLGGSTLPGRDQGRAATRFGHPALYRSLITPMVHAQAQSALSLVYRGRSDNDGASLQDHSDIALSSMSRSRPGKTSRFDRFRRKDFFEVVPESRLDFEFFKDRSDFGDEHGGCGIIYGHPVDLISERSGTPKSYAAGSSHGSVNSSRASSSASPGIRPPPGLGPRAPPSTSMLSSDRNDVGVAGHRGTPDGRRRMYQSRSESEHHLLSSAQPVDDLTPVPRSPDVMDDEGMFSRETPDEAHGYDYFQQHGR